MTKKLDDHLKHLKEFYERPYLEMQYHYVAEATVKREPWYKRLFVWFRRGKHEKP